MEKCSGPLWYHHFSRSSYTWQQPITWSEETSLQLVLMDYINWCVLNTIVVAYAKSKSKLYYDWQSASLSWCHAPIWDPWPIFLLLSLIISRQLQICWGGTPSLTRSWVCSFQFLLGISSAAFLRFESQRTHQHILLCLFLRFPQPGGPGSCIYFPQE
jgi:hypothetical protein